MDDDTLREMLPCPFCGGPASVWTTSAYSSDSSSHVLGCHACEIGYDFANVFQSEKPTEYDLLVWNTRTRTPDLAAEVLRLRAEKAAMVEALEAITMLQPRPFDNFPEDWRDQIDACPECTRYKNHPIQRGICDEHRRPLYDRDAHDEHETRALGYRMRSIAQAALAAIREAQDTGKDRG